MIMITMIIIIIIIMIMIIIVILLNIVCPLKQCCFTAFSMETMFQAILRTSLSFT